MEKDIIYGGTVIVLVALLVFSVLTQGFGLMPCQTTIITPQQNNSNSTGNTGMVPGVTQLSVAVGDMPALGKTTAPVTWIEFSEYQCPYCSKLVVETNTLVKSNYVNLGKVKMYFRDFPLSFHDKAMDAAMATRCANDQGKFWEMHDKLFVNQASWSGSSDFSSVLTGYAIDLGMDTGKFNACVAGNTYSAEIGTDMQAGSSAGISGTPGVFLLLPKSKTDYTALQSALSAGYGQYMELYQDNDYFIVKIVGALPYSAFDSVLKTVSY